MKKVGKGMLVLSIGLLLTGCGCKNNNDEDKIQVENEYNADYVFDDVSTNLSKLYNESVTSTVRILASGSRNDGAAVTKLGSGVVYKEEGDYAYILTNAHVIKDTQGDYTTNIEVIFSNYARVSARAIAYDKNEDVAVISVAKSSNYTIAKFVNKDSDVKVGDSVYSIGNPNGQYFAVTTGVISSNRIKTDTYYVSGTTSTLTYVYNSTATINTGNSGGPMFNSNGEVIAINSMQPIDDNKKNHNYSIPINYFMKVADYLITNRVNYTKTHLNLDVRSVSDYSVSEKNTIGIVVGSGVYVVTSNEEGIARGRIITHINGVKINTFADYEFELLQYNKNDTITVTVSDIVGNNVKDVNVKVK